MQGSQLEEENGECMLFTLYFVFSIIHDNISFIAKQLIFSVQTSYKLNLPPHLIIHSSSIKLVETIGQGKLVTLECVHDLHDIDVANRGVWYCIQGAHSQRSRTSSN